MKDEKPVAFLNYILILETMEKSVKRKVNKFFVTGKFSIVGKYRIVAQPLFL
jgi:hypothetical protein